MLRKTVIVLAKVAALTSGLTAEAFAHGGGRAQSWSALRMVARPLHCPPGTTAPLCTSCPAGVASAHEIRDSKDVIFHEAPEIGDGSDVRVNRMVQQRCAKAAKVIIVVFRHV